MVRFITVSVICLAMVGACGGRPLWPGEDDDSLWDTWARAGLLPEPEETSAVRACIRSVACGIKAYPQVDHCLDDLRVVISPAMSAALASSYHCVNEAQTCEDVARCYGGGESCDMPFEANCDDQVAVACDLVTGRVVRYDCWALGATCALDDHYRFDARCEGEPLLAAFTPGFEARCEDGICEQGEACTGENLSHCDGERLQLCLDSRWVSYDCGALGLDPCRMTNNDWGSCTAPETVPAL